jgi:hypothetical protein
MRLIAIRQHLDPYRTPRWKGETYHLPDEAAQIEIRLRRARELPRAIETTPQRQPLRPPLRVDENEHSELS